MKKEDWEYSIRRIIHLSRLDDIAEEFRTRDPEIERYKRRFESDLQELGFIPESSYVFFMEKQRYRPHPTDGGDKETMEAWEAFIHEVFINIEKRGDILVVQVQFHQYRYGTSNKFLASCWSHTCQFAEKTRSISQYFTQKYPSADIELRETSGGNEDITGGIGFIVKIPISEIQL